MAFEKLSREDQEIILRCMKATDAHVPDWEKPARLGLPPNDLRSVMNEWPQIDDSDDDAIGFLAINNCLNEVCHGFHLDAEEWNKWFNKPKPEVQLIYRTWLSLRGISGGIR